MFRVIAVAVVVGLLLKDLSFVGDRYIIRSTVELSSLLVGLYWMATSGSITAMRRQIAPIAYLFVLLLSAFVSLDVPSVLLQVTALAAIMLFSIAYFSTVQPKLAIATILVPALWVYALVLAGCLIYGKLAPTVAFVYEWGDPVPRFRGLFGEPAQLGIIAGLTIGFSVLVRTWWIVRIPAFIAGIMSVYYTYSRTFWIAVLAAFAVTAWVYKPKLRIPMAVGGIAVLLGGAVYMDTIIKDQSRVLRADSLTNLSGRTEIWAVAMEKFQERPILGYGFTLGADAMMNSDVIQGLLRQNGSDGQFVNTPTLHNGYVQAMLDSGLLGVVLYTAIVLGSIIQLWRNDARKKFAPVMYVLVFSMVGNVGETYIFGAAQSHQALFWMMAVFALGLSSRVPRRAVTKPKSLGNLLTARG
jgi:O-antigen ligase